MALWYQGFVVEGALYWAEVHSQSNIGTLPLVYWTKVGTLPSVYWTLVCTSSNHQPSISSVAGNSLEVESQLGKFELLPLVNKSLWHSARLANEPNCCTWSHQGGADRCLCHLLVHLLVGEQSVRKNRGVLPSFYPVTIVLPSYHSLSYRKSLTSQEWFGLGPGR